MKINWSPLCVITYTDNLNSKGKTWGPFVKIKDRDPFVFVHEMIHVKQFWRTFGLHWFLYPLSKKYRLKAELEAYATGPSSLYEDYAKKISSNYELDISAEEAEKELWKRY